MSVYIVMGVSGCGKTTIGRMLAERMGLPFFDGDDFHSEANKQKMAAGIPLTDDDRRPWLESLARCIAEWNSQRGAVLACSALKEGYRQILRSRDGHVVFLHLEGRPETIRARMRSRTSHYMKAKMLDSQFAVLEAPDDAIKLDIDKPAADIVEEALRAIEQRGVGAQ